MKRLNIYIDESGDPGFTKGGSKLYTISFTLHETMNSLEKEIKYLNDCTFVNDVKQYFL